MKHIIYRLENTKITFKHYQPINSKLYQPTFNYPKFHVISHFVQYIENYGSVIKNNTAHKKAAHQYFLKAFYNRTNKKEHNSQI